MLSVNAYVKRSRQLVIWPIVGFVLAEVAKAVVFAICFSLERRLFT